MSLGNNSSVRIIGVAIRTRNGLVLFEDAPARHHNLMQRASAEKISLIGASQGFLTSEGCFVSRKAAELIARSCGQLQKRKIGSIFTSEDLW